jgi:hypothetical protein
MNVFHRSVERVSLSRRRARLSWCAALSAAVEKQGCRVTRSSSARRTTSLGALVLVLGLGVAGCGDDAKATDDPTETASTSATPTPTPTPTAAPLSPFEDRAPVKTLRSWAAAVTQDINERHRDFPAARAFEVDTKKVRHDVAVTFQEEFDKYYPGPLPFTPVSVTGSGRRATVTTCVIGAGFALNKAGGVPAEKREVISVVFTLAKEQSSWLLSGIVLGTADCGGVKIKGVQW